MSDFKVGDRIQHRSYGKATIKHIRGDGLLVLLRDDYKYGAGCATPVPGKDLTGCGTLGRGGWTKIATETRPFQVGDIVDYTSTLGARYNQKGRVITAIEGDKYWIAENLPGMTGGKRGGWTYAQTLTLVTPVAEPKDYFGFKVGDTVQYINSGTDVPFGTKGTVIDGEEMSLMKSSKCVPVRWEKNVGYFDNRSQYAVYPKNIQKIDDKEDIKVEQKFEVGAKVKLRSRYEAVWTGVIIAVRGGSSSIVIVKRDDGRVDSSLRGAEAGGWAMFKSDLEVTEAAVPPVPLTRAGQWKPGAKVRFTVKASRSGSTLSVGCKSSDANSLFASDAVTDHTIENGQHVLTFETEVKDLDGVSRIEIAGQRAGLGEVLDYSNGTLVLLNPPVEKKVKVEAEMSIEDAELIYSAIGKLAGGDDLYNIWGNLRKAIDAAKV